MNLSFLRIYFPHHDYITRMFSTDYDRLDIFIHGMHFNDYVYSDTYVKKDTIHSHFVSKCDPESV